MILPNAVEVEHPCVGAIQASRTRGEARPLNNGVRGGEAGESYALEFEPY